MANITITNHPLIQHKLSILRDKHTASKEFRTLVGEIAMLMCYEATRDLPLKDVEIETPVSKMTTKALAGKKLAFVPILRAGLGMVDGVLTLVPSARVGHIGLYRDPETHVPVEYYCKLPNDISERQAIVLDPMLATGGSAVFGERAMKKLKSGGKTVFLDVPLEEIERRINNITTRGIAMQRGETLESVYNERLPLYKK